MSPVQFTVLIRLPFSRGDFVDPPQADWNATKDRALWKVISKSSRTSDLNSVGLHAERSQVPQTFLLQQAAWLYERHLEHVRSQMKKVGGSNAPATAASGNSNIPLGGVPMQRGGSHGSRASRAPSALSIRPKDSPITKPEIGSPATAFSPQQPPLSRTPSTNTITQSRAFAQSLASRPQQQRPARPSVTGPRPSITPAPSGPSSSQVDYPESPTVSALSSSSSSSSESDMDGPAHRSQLFKRPPRFQKQKPRDLLSYDEEPEEGDDHDRSSDASLPFAQPQRDVTLRGGGAPADKDAQSQTSDPPRPSQNDKGKQPATSRPDRLDASSSLASSASDAPKPQKPGPLSPKHRAELPGLSPRRAGTRAKKEGSEGTPSMGSSFSDLDDASISQSALEEALLSNIHAGRMSTFSQLRSKYL
ncbi:uncharacterized protein EI97DRAFT_480252 [Westerdykella ornata]|uniref:Autophagy-related protein 29 n=1 Tax=Westerdykella ornata TaxID=318751 RepID=A0A6A6JBR0_WESOR|nr:uncharacterized protein EI97DRAFT_480252 [Westerdykella ornata]KAF2273697.1 hypothetical protein EI97DRAFT_480252 [Westerdykella ornata]